MTNQEIADRASQLLDKIQKKFPQLSIPQIQEQNKPQQQTIDVKPVQNQIIEPIKTEAIEQNCSRISVDKLKNLLAVEETKQLHYNYTDDTENKQIANVNIIQSFFGTDVNRITATTRALQVMLKSNPFPKDWIFVESQINKSKAVFSWLKEYGVKYIFKKYEKESEGLLLKTALWNIGASQAKTDKFCFIDSDIVFCNQDWLVEVEQQFDLYDVLSLAGYCYYEGNPDRKNVVESIGHTIMRSNETEFTGHIGFNIGMTRHAYEDVYGRFEAFNLHDDVWIWQRIIGSENKPDNDGWNPYKSTEQMKYGLPLKVGSSEETCCHLSHGNSISDKYKIYGYASNLGTSIPFEDITYDKSNIVVLPVWNKSKVGQSVKRAFELISQYSLEQNFDAKSIAEELLLHAKKEVYGEIDDEHPLIIFTAFVPVFKHKDIESVFEHKENLEMHCKQPFTYVCFTNEISIEEAQERGLDVIPFSSEKVRNDRSLWQNEMKRKDVKVPKGAVKVWIGFNEKFDKEFEIARN